MKFWTLTLMVLTLSGCYSMQHVPDESVFRFNYFENRYETTTGDAELKYNYFEGEYQFTR